MVIFLSSNGCRKLSSIDLGNSGISSKNRTPLCARLISPGKAFEPPPITETLLAV